MNLLKLILSLSIWNSMSWADWKVPSFENCDFYRAAENTVNCKKNGSDYLMGYGHHFCSEFKKKLPEWKNRLELYNWTNNVGLCLQEMMFDNRQKRLNPCAQLEEFAFDAHPVCYKQYQVCNLSLKDKLSIFSVVEGVHLLSRRSLAQFDNVLLACLDGWISPAEIATFKQIYRGTESQPENTKRMAMLIFRSAPENAKARREQYFRNILPDLVFDSPSTTASAAINAYIDDLSSFDSISAAIDSREATACLSSFPNGHSQCGSKLNKALTELHTKAPMTQSLKILDEKTLLKVLKKHKILDVS